MLRLRVFEVNSPEVNSPEVNRLEVNRLEVNRLEVNRLEVDSQELCPESTLTNLTLFDFQVEAHHLGTEVALFFERYAALPGVVLLEQGQLLGMISRQRLLEFLLRPQGMEFLSQPLSLLYSYTRSNSLVLPEKISILTAAHLALRRSPDQQSEPIVIQRDSQTYLLLDVHELNLASWQIRGIETQVRYERSQVQMIQTEKMASLGRLVDGVAHEILDPVGFIWGNLTHLSTYTNQLMDLLTAYETHFPDVPVAITDLQSEIELDYVREDLPQTIASIKSGADRLKKLVTSLQNFCHIDDVYPKPADLHECLDGIVLLLKSRLTGEIEIVRNYGHLPPVACYAGQLHQVFMNILTNAVNALLNRAIRQEFLEQLDRGQIAAQSSHHAKPQITITTQIKTSPPLPCEVGRSTTRWVSICIADNGSGLSVEKQQQILDSFSVDRRAEKETSLSVSYQIVTAKHGGKFYLRSPAQTIAHPATNSDHQGTEFEILLPLVREG